jgi:hypothetical protein
VTWADAGNSSSKPAIAGQLRHTLLFGGMEWVGVRFMVFGLVLSADHVGISTDMFLMSTKLSGRHSFVNMDIDGIMAFVYEMTISVT